MGKRLILYHADCVDGWVAAWCCWLVYGDTAEYVPVQYGHGPPDVMGRDVTIVDFSYPRGVLLRLKEQAASLRVYDHHKSAAEDLAGLDFCVFDMQRSGAGLAWDEVTVPEMGWSQGIRDLLVDYVEDRDLWRFKLPCSREINSALHSLPQERFRDWRRIAAELAAGTDRFVIEGTAILRSVEQYVAAVRKHAILRSVHGHHVPTVNAAAQHTSDLVGALAEGHPFAVSWWQRDDGMYVYSLRSRGDFDVSEIAKRHDGGGHKNAAGFVARFPADILFERSKT